MNSRLHRSYDDRVLAGVAGGIAETYDLDPALVRICWALLIIITGGVFLLLYIVMALVVPIGVAQPSTFAPPPTTPGGPPMTPPGPFAPAPDYGRNYAREYRHYRRHNGSGALVFGVFLMLVGAYFLVREFVPNLNSNLFWPLLIVFGGVLLIATAINRPKADA